MQVGKILAIALRSRHLGPMIEAQQVTAVANGCLQDDHGSSQRRGLTLLSSTQWQHVSNELGVDLPWHTRRANVLVEAPTLAPLIGKKIRIDRPRSGQVGAPQAAARNDAIVRVQIHAETKPCSEMDEFHPGLKDALVPDCRGGVYGKILDSGQIQVGDYIVVES